jgi:peptidoglycan/xylan/chitin deacetylase (PgdA/CDA1 family)
MSIWSVFYFITQCFMLWVSLSGPGLIQSATTFEQTSVQEKRSAQIQLDSNTQYLYLSFDDGPLFGTSACISICEDENVKATFFQIGLHQSRSNWGKKLYNRILSRPDLFLLSNHSFTHTYGKYVQFYNQPDTALADFIHAADVLETTNDIVRLPGNNGWRTDSIRFSSKMVRPLLNKLDSAGFNVVGWDLEWNYTKRGRPIQSASEMAKMVDSMFALKAYKTKNHLVVLMHDHMFKNEADSVQLVQFIQLLKSGNRYQFASLDQYPGLKKSRINN